MYLNVKQRGLHVATFRWIEVDLMETLAAWVPTTPEMEVKLLFGAHIWDAAQHADALGKRTQELRLPEQHSIEPVADYVDLHREIAALGDTTQRIAAVYDCLLPALDRRFRDYTASVDALLDAPTVRILERIMLDSQRMVAEAAELRAELPVLRGDPAWLHQLRLREATVPQVVREPDHDDALADV